MTPAIQSGAYAEKQLSSRSRLIRWSHQRRFEVAVGRSAAFAGGRLLDYGCGDATYFDLLSRSPHAPASALGVDRDGRIVEDDRRRFAGRPGIAFAEPDELERPGMEARFDAIVCMEVMEHVVEPDPLLDLFVRLLAPGGRLLISVPVETGLPLLVKQTARRVAGWRGIGDYATTLAYTWPDLVRGVFAGARQHMAREVHFGADKLPFHHHKGFNWQALRERIAARFELDRVSGSPVTWLPPHLGSQVWFEARKPAQR